MELLCFSYGIRLIFPITCALKTGAFEIDDPIVPERRLRLFQQPWTGKFDANGPHRGRDHDAQNCHGQNHLAAFGRHGGHFSIGNHRQRNAPPIYDGPS